MRTIAQILTGSSVKSIEYDFKTYRKKHNSFFQNKQEELEIRYKNIQDVLTTLQKIGITHWLQGKTMLGIYKHKSLIENDSDEDVGTDIKNVEIVCLQAIPELEKIGFQVIRATPNNSMVTIMRKNRYIDICFFSTSGSQYYYEQKRFPKHFYEKIIYINVNNFLYPVPKLAKEICKFSYNL